jgi:oxygen-independent coproporphyrinogen-3 oxidase
MTKPPVGVYVHFPFCRSRCPYCAFYSEVRREDVWPDYLAAISREIAARAADPRFAARAVSSLYIGGGTPSLLEPDAVSRLLAEVTAAFAPTADLEVTIEANPESVELEKLRRLRNAGVNRLSLGWQALRDELLEALGRIHCRRDNLRAFSAARDAGFTNVGVDLIFGIPGQGTAGWREDLAETAALGPEHVSAYELTVEEGTQLARARADGTWSAPAEQERVDMFAAVPEQLAAAGIARYEISNFSRPGKQCRHNLDSWRGGDVLGLGVSAASHFENERWLNVADVDAYIVGMSAGGCVANPVERSDELVWAAEDIYLGLRLAEGVQAETRLARVPEPQRSRLVAVLVRAERSGLVTSAGGRARLTARGLLFADSVFEELLAP